MGFLSYPSMKLYSDLVLLLRTARSWSQEELATEVVKAAFMSLHEMADKYGDFDTHVAGSVRPVLHLHLDSHFGAIALGVCPQRRKTNQRTRI